MDNTVTCLWMVDPRWGTVMLISDSFLGSKNDQQVFGTVEWDRLLNVGEIIETDMGYTSPWDITKWKKVAGADLTRMQKADNAEIYKSRIKVENLFAWTDTFAICHQKLRSQTIGDGAMLLKKHNRNDTIVCAFLK